MGRVRSVFKWGIFLSSYVPLFLILSYKHASFQYTIPTWIPLISGLEFPILTAFWLTLSVISLLILYFIFDIRKSEEPEPKNIESVTNRNDAITNYILVYIFPFVVLDLSQLVNWVAFIGFFLVIGIIQVRSNNLYVNPILGLIGYNIYDVDTDDEEKLTLLINKRIGNQSVHVSTVD